MENIDEYGFQQQYYYLNVTRLLIAKTHPQNQKLNDTYRNLNNNLLNNFKSHLSKCPDFKDIKRMMLVKEIGDVDKKPHIHSILVFESKNMLISVMKYIQTRIISAYRDDVNEIPEKDVPKYVYYILKTYNKNWKIYKDYYLGNKEDELLLWRKYFKKIKVYPYIIEHITVNERYNVTVEKIVQEEAAMKQILSVLEVEEAKDECLFVD